MPTKEQIKQINLAWIVVSDFAKALKYYTEVVGLKVRESHPEFGWAELVGTEGGGCLGIAQANDRESIPAGSNAVVTFTVTDLAKAKAEFQRKGVKMIGDVCEVPGHVKLQTFVDTDGNRFQLVETL